MIPPPPSSTLFPYTTLFRSRSTAASSAGRCACRRECRRATAGRRLRTARQGMARRDRRVRYSPTSSLTGRSEEHTSELQSHHDLVCRLLLEKKKKTHEISYL